MKKILLILLCILISASLTYGTVTKTTNLELSKPASEDTTVDWFDTMNDNMDLIDAIFDTVSLVEFDCLDGVTSAIQTQLDAKIEATLTQEEVEDYSGSMWTGNTETFINLTYQDADGTVDAVVPVKDEDNMVSNSATHLATQQSIKAYADTKQTHWVYLDQIGGMSPLSGDIIIGKSLDGSWQQVDGVFTDYDTHLLKHESGGLEADVSAYDGFLKISEGATSAITPSSDDLSDVAFIGMLDEGENVTGRWDFKDSFYITKVHDSSSAFIEFYKKRDGDPTDDVSSGDAIGNFDYFAWHTDNYYWAASIKAVVDGTGGVNDMPGRLEFLTTPDGTATPVKRIAIDNAGNIKMGDGVWTNYVNVTNAGVLTLEGTANIEGIDATELGYLNGISAFGGSIIDDADEATFKATVNLEVGTDVLAQQTIGIGDDNLLEVDDADAADDEYAKFTANGLEGRSYAEVMMDTNPVTTVTAVHTMTVAEAGTVLVSCAATPYTITLPTAVGHSGLRYHFIKTDANYFLITLDGDGTETINYENSTGAPCLTYPRLNTYQAGVTLVSDNTNWQVSNEQMGQVPMARVYLSDHIEDLKDNKYLIIPINAETYDIGNNWDMSEWVSGTADGTVANHLQDDTNSQFTAGMVGYRIKNTTDSTYAWIITFNDAGDITLSTDIFVDTEGYEIKNAKYVCPVPGYYSIFFKYNLKNGSVIVDANYLAALYLNGANTAGNWFHASTTGALTFPIENIINCAIDDEITMVAKLQGGVDTVDMSGSTTATFMTVQLTSKD